MSRSGTLACLALLLATGVAAEVLGPAPHPPIPAPARLPQATPLAVAAVDVSQAATTALARPLFTPGRHVDRAVAHEAAEPGPPPVPRLSGTILTGRGRFAVFEPGGDRHPMVVALGNAVDGWTVQSIADGVIVVARPGAVRTVTAQYSATVPQPPGPPQGLLATKKTDPHLQP